MTKPVPAPNAEQPQAFVSPPGPSPSPSACHCPCDAHPEFPGTCSGHAEPGFTGVLDAPTGGSRHVPMCRNCHDIRMGLAPQRESSLEAVTDTCTCHCQANHPDRPGICAAASQDGVLIEGRPVCLACEDAGHGRNAR